MHEYALLRTFMHSFIHHLYIDRKHVVCVLFDRREFIDVFIVDNHDVRFVDVKHVTRINLCDCVVRDQFNFVDVDVAMFTQTFNVVDHHVDIFDEFDVEKIFVIVVVREFHTIIFHVAYVVLRVVVEFHAIERVANHHQI